MKKFMEKFREAVRKYEELLADVKIDYEIADLHEVYDIIDANEQR